MLITNIQTNNFNKINFTCKNNKFKNQSLQSAQNQNNKKPENNKHGNIFKKIAVFLGLVGIAILGIFQINKNSEEKTNTINEELPEGGDKELPEGGDKELPEGGGKTLLVTERYLKELEQGEIRYPGSFIERLEQIEKRFGQNRGKNIMELQSLKPELLEMLSDEQLLNVISDSDCQNKRISEIINTLNSLTESDMHKAIGPFNIYVLLLYGKDSDKILNKANILTKLFDPDKLKNILNNDQTSVIFQEWLRMTKQNTDQNELQYILYFKQALKPEFLLSNNSINTTTISDLLNQA